MLFLCQKRNFGREHEDAMVARTTVPVGPVSPEVVVHSVSLALFIISFDTSIDEHSHRDCGERHQIHRVEGDIPVGDDLAERRWLDVTPPITNPESQPDTSQRC